MHLDPAARPPPEYAPAHVKKKTGYLPPKTGLVTPLCTTTKHLRAYIVSMHELKKVIYRVLQNKNMAKRQILKWEKDCQILKHTETSKLCGTLAMKTMKKNAREHNINKVMQELIAAGLRIDNQESLKKNK